MEELGEVLKGLYGDGKPIRGPTESPNMDLWELTEAEPPTRQAPHPSTYTAHVQLSLHVASPTAKAEALHSPTGLLMGKDGPILVQT